MKRLALSLEDLKPSDIARLFNKCSVTESGCWEWTGGSVADGYGGMDCVIGGRRRTVRSHRLAYTILVGTVPIELDLDHLCENRLCINPFHLEPVDHRTNVLRSQPVALSGYLGVRKARGRWTARINTAGQQRHLGTFDTPEAAALAYDAAARSAYGPNTPTNFPDDQSAAS